MIERFDHFLDIVAWLVVVVMGLHTLALFIAAVRYEDSYQQLLDKMHGRTRTFPWGYSMLWVLVACAWLFA